MHGNADARSYLTQHQIPQLFEGLMTGLIYSKPENALEFLKEAIISVCKHPTVPFTWDMFINDSIIDLPREFNSNPAHQKGQTAPKAQVTTNAIEDSIDLVDSAEISREPSRTNTVEHRSPEPRVSSTTSQEEMVVHRVPSVTKAADVAKIPNVPIILFMGGPGGGKTRHAARVANSLEDKGLIHICMPDLIRSALAKYKDKYPEWKEANEHYSRGELIPNHLALTLLKAEMGRHPEAQGYFLEGYPREARQVEDFERQIKPVNLAMILDYDERTLRDHMERRGLGMEIIDQKIKEFKQKTLPSAKYFDDERILHLIPGEKDENTIYEKMKRLILKAIETGVPVINHGDTSGKDEDSIDDKKSEKSGKNSRNQTSSSQRLVSPPAVVTHSDGNVKPPKEESIVSATETVQERKKSISTVDSTEKETAVTRGSTAETPTVQTPSEKSVTPVERSAAVDTPAVHTPSDTASHPHSAKSRIETPARSSPKSSVNEQVSGPVVIPMLNLPNENDTSPDKNDSSAQNKVDNVLEKTEYVEPIGLPNNAPVILIIGAPGSQKKDIGRRIAQKYDGFTLLSMGEIIRKKIKNEPNDELWNKVEKKLNNGESIPTKICRSLLYEELQSRGSANWGYVIEGYPKTPDQFIDLEYTLQRVDLAILIDCTEQFCIDLIDKRNIENKRDDDTPEFVRAKLDFFKKNTLPMLKIIDEKGKLRVVRIEHATVDGDSDPDTVFKEVVQKIDGTLFIEDDGEGTSLGDSKKGVLSSSSATT